MSIEWFDRTAGNDIMTSRDDDHMLLIGSLGVGDHVKVPESTGNPGVQRIIGKIIGPCPGCKQEHFVMHYELTGPVWFAECMTTGQFFWYQSKNTP